MSKREGEERRYGTTKRMTSHPNLGIRIQCRDIVVQVLSSVIVSVLLAKGRDEAGGVAGEGRGLTVADLSPQVLPALAAAAAEKQIVVDLVVCSRLGTIEHGGRCTLQAYDDCRVLGISEDVASQTV